LNKAVPQGKSAKTAAKKPPQRKRLLIACEMLKSMPALMPRCALHTLDFIFQEQLSTLQADQL
jgi:hypothetical protein